MAPSANTYNGTPLSKKAMKNMKKHDRKRQYNEAAAVVSKSPDPPSSSASSSMSPSAPSDNLTSSFGSEDEERISKSLVKPLIPIKSSSPRSGMGMATTVVSTFSQRNVPATEKAWETSNGISVASRLFPGTKKSISSSASLESRYDKWDGTTAATMMTPSVSSTTAEVSSSEWIVVPETEKEKAKRLLDEAIKGWPWSGNPPQLKTIAPWAASGHPWTLPNAQNNTKSALFSKLFRNDVVKREILGYVFQSAVTMDTFARLCQDSFNTGSEFIQIWDVTHADFQDCELPRIPQYEILKDPSLANNRQGSVRPVVIVTPIRTGEGPVSYKEQVQNLHSMCVASKNFFDHLQNIQFHRVPFLTIHIIELLIPKMWKLRFLGVYNCQLIHVGHTVKLLQIIEKHADAVLFRAQVRTPHATIKKRWANLDFFPRFSIGPVDIAGESKYAGSYGCTWDNHGMDSRQAIWSIVDQAIATPQGRDLVGKETAFRKWLHKGPCLYVETTLNKMLNPENESTRVRNLSQQDALDELAAFVRYDKFRGEISRLYKHQAFPSEKGWATRIITCRDCKVRQKAIFYHFNYVRRMRAGQLSDHAQCSGCLLDSKLRAETDHYKKYKRRIIGKWIEMGRKDGIRVYNSDDVDMFLEQYYNRNILSYAGDLDRQRGYDIADQTRGGDEYDHELDERQIPMSARELRHKVGTRWRSPDIYDTVEKACFDRYDGHGMNW